MTDHIEPHIIQDSRHGSKAAFRVIVRQYQQMVFSLAVKMLCDEEDAKDAVQETFTRMWLNLNRYDPSQRFTTWVYAIATHVCLNMLKRRKHSTALSNDESLLKCYVEDIDGHKILENGELMAIVHSLTDELSPKQKLVFTLCQLEGLSTTEVMQITGLNVIQIKSNLYLARQNIKKKLKKLGYE